MASGDLLAIFNAGDCEPPTSNPATLDRRNGHFVLNFDTATQEIAIWSGVLPPNYGGGGITVIAHWCAASATSGTGGWDSAFERVGDAAATPQDIDADSFATAKTITAATVPGTSGQLAKTNVAHTNSEIDGLLAGEAFRFRIRRDVANDSAAGDLQLKHVELRET